MSKCAGPGYASPLEAMKGPREEILYVVCIQPNPESGKSDCLATVDVNPDSPTYCKIIHRLHTGRPNDELHHSGWNTCSSCFGIEGCGSLKRDKLVLPALGSDRIYFVNVGDDPRAPKIEKVVEADEMHQFNCATPHTTHCLPSGEIMISVMGDVDGNGKGDFVLIDGKTLKTKGTWTKGKLASFGYDFWYQPYHDIMVSSEWGAPKVFKRGFHPDDATSEFYGRHLNFYSWSKREMIQRIDLGTEGIAPLEVRFLHNPKASQGFVGCAVNSHVFRFYKTPHGLWEVESVIEIKPKKVSGWITEYVGGMITDILISLDDKYLYLSNWFHGDVRQYDITNPEHPVLTGQVFLGGLAANSKLKIVEDPENAPVPHIIEVKGRRVYGSPQMLQLSLDGKRLYVTSSLFSPWDKHFYPETIKYGSTLLKLDVDTENGGMKLDDNFLVDFGVGPDGPLLAHEVRYPGGDCTSDIWLATD